jgi:hypothetical protein
MLDPSSTPSGNRTAAKLLRSKHCMYEDIPIHLFISSGSAGRVPFYAAIGLWSSLWDDQALRAQTVENAHIEADTPSASASSTAMVDFADVPTWRLLFLRHRR